MYYFDEKRRKSSFSGMLGKGSKKGAKSRVLAWVLKREIFEEFRDIFMEMVYECLLLMLDDYKK